MKPNQRTVAAMASVILACSLSACAADAPTAPEQQSLVSSQSAGLHTSSLAVPVTGVLSDGGTFTGVLTVTQFALDAAGNLVASGTLVGSATTVIGETTAISQAFSDIAAALTSTPRCQILTLDIGAIHLDLLGLVVDLAPVNLDVAAEPGPGNLLGNLLCALTHLLDNPLASIASILALIERINAVLGAL